MRCYSDSVTRLVCFQAPPPAPSNISSVAPLFWYTRPSLGGFGFNPNQISYFMCSIGIAQSIWLLVFFPILHRKYGTGTILRACYFIWPLTFVVAPLCNYFLRQGWTTAFWIIGTFRPDCI